MKKSKAVICICCAALCAALPASAFVEPTGTIAVFPSPAVLNVGSGSQTKMGDLTLQNAKASGISLGEERRTSWLGVGASCKWEGWRCDCRSDDSSFASMALTIGVRCGGGRISDMVLFPAQISSRTKSCGRTAPAPCAQSLYTYDNSGGRTLLESIVGGVVAVGQFIADAAVGTVKTIATVTKAVFDFQVAAVTNMANTTVSIVKGAVSLVGAAVSVTAKAISAVVNVVVPVAKVVRRIICFGFC